LKHIVEDGTGVSHSAVTADTTHFMYLLYIVEEHNPTLTQTHRFSQPIVELQDANCIIEIGADFCIVEAADILLIYFFFSTSLRA